MSDQFIKKEKAKARELRQTRWWKTIASSMPKCHFCAVEMERDQVTMDHLIPLSRGGRTTKGNVVPCCKECNNKKKNKTPVELILEALTCHTDRQ